ncbi:MAG: cell division protein ZapA [Spirochaetales bacterium]|nr:cell division protein ZapA [Spirochaetales bacterium]
MAGGCRLQINLLGSSFAIRADEDEAYLKRILWYLEKKVEETRQRNPVADPMKISLLTSFYIIDELMREKSRGSKDGVLPEEAEEMEKIALRLMSEIDAAIANLPKQEETGE